MIKINIFNMENFLQTVNSCGGAVNLIHPDGRGENINKQYDIQERLRKEHAQNKQYLPLILDIRNTKDYMNIVFFSIGDC